MLELVEIGIGIGIVHQSIQKFESSPDRHLFFIISEELRLLLLNEFVRLISMVQPVKLPHRISPRRFVIPICFGRLALRNRLRIRIAFQEIFLPYIEGGERILFSSGLISHGSSL